MTRAQEREWVQAADTKLTDEQIAYWINALPNCDYLSGGGRRQFYSAVTELAEFRAAGVVIPEPVEPKLPRIKWQNLVAGVRDLTLRSFTSGDVIGLFHRNAHFSRVSGKPKVEYDTRELAVTASNWMRDRYEAEFVSYVCVFCGKYHLSRAR